MHHGSFHFAANGMEFKEKGQVILTKIQNKFFVHTKTYKLMGYMFCFYKPCISNRDWLPVFYTHNK